MKMLWSFPAGLVMAVVLVLGGACSDDGGLDQRCSKDEECGSGERCDKIRGTCVLDTTPKLEDAARGTFECERFKGVSTAPPQAGPTQVDIELDGVIYQMRGGCGFYEEGLGANSPFLYLSLIGNDTALTKDAWLDIVWRPADNAAGALAAPAVASGWLRTAAMGQITQLPTALVTGGTVTVETVAAKLGDKTKGSLDLKIASFAGGEIGTYCEVPRPCDIKCTLSGPELKNARCKANEYCFPFQDGSRAGFCTNECQTNSKACDAVATAECVKIPIGKLCLKKCTKKEDCSAPLVCGVAGIMAGYCTLK